MGGWGRTGSGICTAKSNHTGHDEWLGIKTACPLRLPGSLQVACRDMKGIGSTRRTRKVKPRKTAPRNRLVRELPCTIS